MILCRTSQYSSSVSSFRAKCHGWNLRNQKQKREHWQNGRILYLSTGKESEVKSKEKRNFLDKNVSDNFDL